MSVRRLRVAVLERHRELRAALVDALEDSGAVQVVWQSGCGRDAAARITELAPDAVLLTYELADVAGADVCAELRAVAPSTPCIVLTARERSDLRRAAMSAGAV